MDTKHGNQKHIPILYLLNCFYRVMEILFFMKVVQEKLYGAQVQIESENDKFNLVFFNK